MQRYSFGDRKVRLFSSIGAQLFLIIGSFSALIVLAMSFLSGRQFYGMLNNQLSERLTHEAGSAAQALGGWLGGHVTVVTLALQAGAGGGEAVAPVARGGAIPPEPSARNAVLEAALLQAILSQKEWVQVDVLQWQPDVGVRHLAIVDTPQGQNTQFRDRDPKVIKEKISEFNEARLVTLHTPSAAPLRRWEVVSPARDIDLPLVQVWIPFGLQGNDKSLRVAVVTLWLNGILQLLPGQEVTQDTRSYFVLKNSDMIATQKEDVLKIGISALPYAAELSPLLGQPPAGPVFATFQQGGILGALAPVENAQGWVVVERNASVATQGVRGIVWRTLLWGAEFVLVAVGVSYVVSSRLSRRIGVLLQATLRIADGAFDTKIPLQKRDELGVLSAAVNHMGGQLTHLLQRSVAAAVVQKEVEAAEATQALIFPKHPGFESPLAQVCGRTMTASRCGGDWWGYFVTHDGFEVIVVGDATGHGLPAALVTALVYASCVGFVREYDAGPGHAEGPSPAKLLNTVNGILWAAGAGRTTMTLFALVLSPRSPVCRYANSGHHFPYVVSSPVQECKTKSLNVGGSAVGAEENPHYDEITLDMTAGMRLVFYSDGLPELVNPAGEAFGKKRFVKLLESLKNVTGWEFIEGVFQSAKHFCGNAQVQDDLTVIVLDYRFLAALDPESTRQTEG